MNDLVLAAGERVELLQHVGDGLDYALANLLHADVPDGAGSVTHLQSNRDEPIPSLCSIFECAHFKKLTVCLSLLESRVARFCTQL